MESALRDRNKRREIFLGEVHQRARESTALMKLKRRKQEENS